MRILFAGSPEIALPSLRLLHENHHICGVLTNPDRPAGRGRSLVATPVGGLAAELGLPVLKTNRLGSQIRAQVAELDPAPELLVVVAFGRIFGPKFLALFPRGAVNLHPSLLPRYRGPSPIPAAILSGDSETGVTVQLLSLEMDSGDLLAQERVALDGSETTESLTPVLGELGAGLLERVVSDFDRIEPRAQDPAQVSYCRLIAKDDGIIDWQRGAAEIDRMVRAYTPWPGTRTTYEGQPLHILAARAVGDRAEPEPAAAGAVVGVDKVEGILVQTGNGLLAVQRLKLQSKKALNWKDFLNGARGIVGSTLGN